MDERVRTKTVEALKLACLPDDRPEILLDEAGGERIGGAVISTRFERMTPSERQDLIWARLDEALSPYDRTLISFLLTETPNEYEAVRQFPSLDTVDADRFARAVKQRLGERDDAEELEQLARALAEYAKTSEGMSAAQAKTAAERVADAIGYAPLGRAPEDGFGIVLIGARGRAKLAEGEPVTAAELHVLATLVHGRRAPISGNARGEVAHDDALRYLSSRGIRF